jgi:hypothetical protein
MQGNTPDEPLVLHVTLDADESVTGVSTSGDAQAQREYWRFVRLAHARTRAHNRPAMPRTRARGAGRPKAQSTRSSDRSGDSPSDDGRVFLRQRVFRAAPTAAAVCFLRKGPPARAEEVLHRQARRP